jgi:branched-chain amino acid transport system ATP-binding protein
VNAGIARTFQIPRPFHHKTVDANVEISTLPNAIFTRHPTRRERHTAVYTCCTRTGLCQVCGQDPSHCSWESCACRREYPMALPHAGLRKLEVAKALATDPELLLLDEPFAGLTMTEVEDVSRLLQDLRTEGRTLVVVDHNMRGLMKLVDRVVVIHFGQKLAEGAPAEVAENPAVQEAYLAGSAARDESR